MLDLVESLEYEYGSSHLSSPPLIPMEASHWSIPLYGSSKVNSYVAFLNGEMRSKQLFVILRGCYASHGETILFGWV